MCSQYGFNNHHHVFSPWEHWNSFKVEKTWSIIPTPRKGRPLSTQVAFNKCQKTLRFRHQIPECETLHQKSLELSMLLLYFLKLSLPPIRAFTPDGHLSLVHGNSSSVQHPGCSTRTGNIPRVFHKNGLSGRTWQRRGIERHYKL